MTIASSSACSSSVRIGGRPPFQLSLKLDRHEAAKLLPARVNSVAFTSVVSDAGTMLTQARLEMLPGDKRLLSVKLPKDAKFWFAFVNQNGVWPWRERDEILIPLEQQSRNGKLVPVEIFYSSQVGQPAAGAANLELLAPKFDLPLENISWHLHLSDKWRVKDWAGTLQLQGETVTPVATTTMAINTRPHVRCRGNFTANSRYFAGANTPGTRTARMSAPTKIEISFRLISI